MPFSIIRNDITKVKADAIVNTANPEPRYAGGTDGAIYWAAGAEQLLAERKKIGRIAVGEAAATDAFALQAKYIIHTVGPVWDNGENEEFAKLASCYRKSLHLAKMLKCESIAFPLISTGVYGFPKDRALAIATQEISDFLAENEMEVILVVFDKKAFCLSEELTEDVRQYIDDHRAEEIAGREYENRRSIGNRPPVLPSASDAAPAAMPAPSVASPAHPKEGKNKTQSRRRRKNILAELLSYGTGVREDHPSSAQVPFEAVSEKPHAAQRPAKAPNAAPTLAEKPYSAPQPYAAPRKEKTLEDIIGQIGENFQEMLLRLIDEKSMTDAEVYKRANIDRKLFSKIRCNPDYVPKKKTAVALAIALQLSLDETVDLLGRAGIAFSPGNKFDLIIEYCIENKIYNIYNINLILFDYGQATLGC